MADHAGCFVCGEINDPGLQCARCFSREYCGTDCQAEDWQDHQAHCKRQIFILKVDLCPLSIDSPRISRTLSCPADASFADFHHVLMTAFGWTGSYQYRFEVFNHVDQRTREDWFLRPVPLFTVEDPSNAGVDLWSGPPKIDGTKNKLFQVLDNPPTKGKAMRYFHDSGDVWELVVVCVGRAASTPSFSCLDGEGHGCTNDVGGPDRWNELLIAYDSDKRTAQQENCIQLYEKGASNRDPKGLCGALKWTWDKEKINTALFRLGRVLGSVEDKPLTT